MKFRQGVVLAAIALSGAQILAANLKDITNMANVGAIIGWVPQANKYNGCGYYRELPIPYTANPYVSTQKDNYDINADNSEVSFKGTSVLTGHVQVTQPEQRLKSDKAYIYRGKQGKIDIIKMFGHVSYDTPGQLIASHNATVILGPKRVILHNAAYRVALANKEIVTSKNPKTGEQEKRIYDLNFWGTAKKITQTKPKHYVLKDTSYTTCSPNCHTWNMHSTTVNIDKQKEKASAWNTVLYWKKVPVFYMPYVNFPLSKKRKTGFLFPTIGHSTNQGYVFTLPFYWNIAPNYDAMFNTTLYSKRGAMGTVIPRYLSKTSAGNFKFSFLPSDRAFKQFKKDAAGNPVFQNDGPQRLNNLENDSDNRYELHWGDMSHFGSHVSSTIDYTRVSDSYYSQDFGHQYILNDSANQLLQKAELDYKNTHWDVYAIAQGYQTLHPVNEKTVANQYERLPELQANADYPQIWHDLEFGMATQGVRFFQARTPDSTTVPVNGDRFHVDPFVSYPLVSAFGYLTPKLQISETKYQLTQLGQLTNKSPNLALPIFDVHGGLTFDRDFSLFHSHYMQTLEPEFFYLYVPYRNQNNLPIFDTFSQTFTYPVMFEDNRFTGIDRIGDANQMTFAVSSRFVDADTGLQRAKFSIGDILYFRNRDVQLCNRNKSATCGRLTPFDTRRFSPIAGQATYDVSRYWSGSLAATWSPYRHKFDYGNASVAYRHDLTHVLNINYSFVSPDHNDDLQDLKSAGTSGYWVLHRHWALIGGWNHQWGTVNGNTYLAGLGYQSYCWGMRFALLRSINRLDNSDKFQYNTSVYLQFVLKGLGGVSNANISNELENYISGYVDHFTDVD